MVPKWSVNINCNMVSVPLDPSTTLIENNQFIGSFNSHNPFVSPAADTMTFLPGQNPVTTSCPITSNPGAVVYNTLHIDWDFIIAGAFVTDPATQWHGNNRAPWAYYNSFVQDNQFCEPCGTMEGIAMQDGGNFDLAFVNMYGGLTQQIVPTQYSFVSWGVPAQSVVVNNVMLLNSFMGTFSGSSTSNTQTTSLYVINVSGGQNPTFPDHANNLNPKNSGFWDGNSSILAPRVGDTAAGVTDNQTVWPSGGRGVDGAGTINVAGKPSSASMGAVPWCGVLQSMTIGPCAGQTDTGFGSF
jgi:hypothetical protein